MRSERLSRNTIDDAWSPLHSRHAYPREGRSRASGRRVMGGEILEDYPYLEHEDVLAALQYAEVPTDHPILRSA